MSFSWVPVAQLPRHIPIPQMELQYLVQVSATRLKTLASNSMLHLLTLAHGRNIQHPFISSVNSAVEVPLVLALKML